MSMRRALGALSTTALTSGAVCNLSSAATVTARLSSAFSPRNSNSSSHSRSDAVAAARNASLSFPVNKSLASLSHQRAFTTVPRTLARTRNDILANSKRADPLLSLAAPVRALSTTAPSPLEDASYTTTGMGGGADDHTKQRRADNFKGSVVVVRRLDASYSADYRDVQPLARKILDVLGLARFDLAVMLSMEPEVHALNKSSLGVDAATDVLSFPMMEPKGEMQLVEFGDVADLGEIYLCVPYIERQALNRGGAGNTASGSAKPASKAAARGLAAKAGADELPVILVHGILHLCGFDHDHRAARDRMQGATDLVLDALLAQGAITKRQHSVAAGYELEEAPEELSAEAREMRRRRQLSAEPALSQETAESLGEQTGNGEGPGAEYVETVYEAAAVPELVDLADIPTPESLRAAGVILPDGSFHGPSLLAFMLARKPAEMSEEQVRADVAAVLSGQTEQLAARVSGEIQSVADKAADAAGRGELAPELAEAARALAQDVNTVCMSLGDGGATSTAADENEVDGAETEEDAWRGEEEVETDAIATPRAGLPQATVEAKVAQMTKRQQQSGAAGDAHTREMELLAEEEERMTRALHEAAARAVRGVKK